MTRTEQQKRAYFKWLSMLAEQMQIDRINTAMLILRTTRNGYEVPLTGALVDSWFEDSCMGLDMKWGKLQKEVKSAVFGGICNILYGLGIDTSRITTRSRKQFCKDAQALARESGVTVTAEVNGVLGRKLFDSPLTADVLHETFAKPQFMHRIAPGITTTNDLEREHFQMLCESMAKWAIECGVRNLPDFPDRNRVPVECYQ